MLSGRVGTGYYLLDGLGLYGEFYAVSIRGSGDNGEDQKTFGGGGDLVLRWHFLRQPLFTIYSEAAFGVVVTRTRFPVGGTRVNFTPQLGLGASFRVHERASVIGGIRRLHISNGKGLVPENPAFDGLGGYFGVVLSLD